PAPSEIGTGTSLRLSSQKSAANESSLKRPSPSEPALPPRSDATAEPPADQTVFVPSGRPPELRARRWPLYVSMFIFFAAVVAVGIMVAWPRLNPLKLDPVERVASDYLNALTTDDSPTIKRLGTVEEPPAIRSVRSLSHQPGADQRLKGS